MNGAATFWFEINLILLFLSIWLLTDGWDGRARLIAFPVGLIFLPVIGSLAVGQFVFPLMLGASMLVYALRREHIVLTTLGTVLLTFKPHLGALMLLSVLMYLIASWDKPALPKEHRGTVSSTEGFGRSALRSIILTGIFLVLISFPADPHWLVRYPSLLLGLSSNYGQSENASLCKDCANLPVSLSRWFFDGSLSKAALIALVLFLVLAVLFFLVRSALLKRPELFLNAALIVTLLVSPYLFNYDFILLVIPLAVLWLGSSRMEKLILGFCYLAPTLLISLYGRAGNLSLLVASVLVALLLLQRARSQVDVPATVSYNTNK